LTKSSKNNNVSSDNSQPFLMKKYFAYNFVGLFLILSFFLGVVKPVFATVSYSYDQNGNMTSNGTNCYVYNEANQLSKVKNCQTQATIEEYIYDFRGKRIITKNYAAGSLQKTSYKIGENYETEKLATNGATFNTNYYYANGELLAQKGPLGNKTYYLNDNLNSLNILTDQIGNIIESTSYLPFGEISSGGTQSKNLYTGQENDKAIGLDYYGARYYDPHARHFTQPDNVLPDVYDPQQLNRYAYVRNNPLTYNDPTGNCPFCVAITTAVTNALPTISTIANYISTNINPIVAQVSQAIESFNKSPGPSQLLSSGLGIASILPIPVIAGETSIVSKIANVTSWPGKVDAPMVIDGLNYTKEALTRMEPVGLGGRGVPPSVVKNAVDWGIKTASDTVAGRVISTYENVRVVTDESLKNIITVIKTGH
jgi:RHS repeat-associated protein